MEGSEHGRCFCNLNTPQRDSLRSLIFSFNTQLARNRLAL